MIPVHRPEDARALNFDAIRERAQRSRQELPRGGDHEETARNGAGRTNGPTPPSSPPSEEAERVPGQSEAIGGSSSPVAELAQKAGLASLGTDSAPDAVEATLRAFAKLLLGADRLRVQTAKAEAVRLLEAANVSRSATLVEAALVTGTVRAKPETARSATAAFPDPDPWPDPVEGAALLEQLVRTFKRFLSLPAGAATACALWVVHAWALDAATVSPLLAITSPQPRCGKTSLMTVLNELVPRPLMSSNVSASVVFRAIERFCPTLLVDEADTFLTGKDAKEDLRGVLNSGHTRAGARVLRSSKVGETWKPEVCSTWAPKAVALIGALPPTLADRSIEIRLERRAAGETVERIRLDRLHAELAPLRSKAARWVADCLHDLRDTDPDVPEGLNDRAADNWRPLLAIADEAGGAWPERARKAASRLSGGTGPDTSIGAMLLSDLREIIGERDTIRSADLVRALGQMEHRSWPEWRNGKPMTANALARQLKPFGVQPKKIRFGDKTENGYERERFKEVFARYIPPNELEQVKQPSNGAEKQHFGNRNTPDSVPVSKSTETPHKTSIVPVVPDEKGRSEQEEIRL